MIIQVLERREKRFLKDRKVESKQHRSSIQTLYSHKGPVISSKAILEISLEVATPQIAGACF